MAHLLQGRYAFCSDPDWALIRVLTYHSGLCDYSQHHISTLAWELSKTALNGLIYGKWTGGLCTMRTISGLSGIMPWRPISSRTLMQTQTTHAHVPLYLWVFSCGSRLVWCLCSCVICIICAHLCVGLRASLRMVMSSSGKRLTESIMVAIRRGHYV